MTFLNDALMVSWLQATESFAALVNSTARAPRVSLSPSTLVGLVLVLVLAVLVWRTDRSRRSTIRALRKRIDWLNEVQNYAVPSLVLDNALRALHANQAAVELLGYETPAGVLEAWDREAIVDRAPLREALPLLRSQESGRTLDLPARRRDGAEIRVALRLHSLGQDLCVVAFADLSEVMAERQRLERIARLEVMGRLAGSVAHDFNNVLAVILAQADFLEEAVANDEAARQGLREIRSSARDAAHIVKQLLAIGRRGSEKLQVVDLEQLLAASERMIRSSLGEGITFDLALGADHPTVRVDPSTFRQALLNIAINARDALGPQGRFAIRTRRTGKDPRHETESVELLLSDNGSGMSAEVRERIFEPFFTTKADERGTGLGLATAYATITGAGGSIDVDSAPGRGATFIIRLPLVRPETSDREPHDSPPSARLPVGPPRTILVVDDEAPLRRLIARALERQGHRVLVAEDGQKAVDLASRHAGPIHLLLTDVRMPTMNGPAAAARIRETRPGIRVIFMTGYAGEDEMEPGTRGVPLDVLSKPFEIPELLQHVTAALARPDPRSASDETSGPTA